jgi:TetR/AcrR family transcriptional repressor of nem operon
MLGAEIATLEPEAAAKLRAFYQANTTALAEILETGRQDGSLRFDGEPEPVARLMFSFLEGAMLVARVVGGVDSFRAQLRVLERFIKK